MSVNDVKPCPLCRAQAFRHIQTHRTDGYSVKCSGCGISTRSVTREELPALVAEWNEAYNTAHTRPANIDTVDYWALKAKYDALVNAETSASLSSQLKLAVAVGQQNKTKVAELKMELNAALDKTAKYAVQLGQLTAAYRYLMQLTEDSQKHIDAAIQDSPFWSKRRILDAVANWKRFYRNRLPANKYPAVPILNERSDKTDANPPKPMPAETLDHKARMERILFDYENTSA